MSAILDRINADKRDHIARQKAKLGAAMHFSGRSPYSRAFRTFAFLALKSSLRT